MSAVLEHRVDRLDDALEAFTRGVGVELNKAYNGQVRLQQEMLDFKNRYPSAPSIQWRNSGVRCTPRLC